MTRVFISHPYADNPPVRRGQNRALIERLQKQYPDVLFISPLLLFDYIDEDDEEPRDDILEACCEIIQFIVDEVWVFGDSEGCRIEKEFAESIGIPIKILQPVKREKGTYMQNRFKSWALWVSVAGLVFLVLTKVVGLQIDAGIWGEVLDAVGVVLIGFGIVNNPTDSKNI